MKKFKTSLMCPRGGIGIHKRLLTVLRVIIMKKYEQFSREELQNFCKESESYRQLAIKIGYKPDGGSGISSVKEMIKKYQLDISHFNGQGHSKNINRIKTTLEDYLTGKVKITSHKLRLRLLKEGIFQPVCSCYGLAQWLGKPIPLELHHKDGDKNNNSLENLELRCPNCHYFTDTYKTKNRKQEHQDRKLLA